MPNIKFRSPLGLYGNLVVGALGLAFLALVFWWFFIRPGQLHQQAQQSKADASYSQGRTTSAQDATKVTENVNNRNSDYDKATSEGNAGILGAKGSSTVPSRDVACASARAQCMQRSYKDSEQCRALLQSCS